MIEKYLRDSITDKSRLELVEKMANTNLIPDRIYAAIRQQDSVRRSKDTSYPVSKKDINTIKDSIGLEQDEETDILDKIKKDKDTTTSKKELPKKDSSNTVPVPEALLPGENKKPEPKDTVKK